MIKYKNVDMTIDDFTKGNVAIYCDSKEMADRFIKDLQTTGIQEDKFRKWSKENCYAYYTKNEQGEFVFFSKFNTTNTDCKKENKMVLADIIETVDNNQNIEIYDNTNDTTYVGSAQSAKNIDFDYYETAEVISLSTENDVLYIGILQ